MEIYRDYALLPITAAEVIDVGLDKILLIGEGPFVKIFSLARSFLLTTVLVFDTQAVHGISCFESSSTDAQPDLLCVVWGGRSLSFVRLQFQKESGTLWLKNKLKSQETKLVDWILDAKFVPGREASTSRVVLLNAHNDLFSMTCPRVLEDTGQVEPVLLASGPPSTLYCGNIQFDPGGDILIASGTVFGAVHLWATESGDAKSRLGRLVTTYAGHEGSVYGISLVRLKTQKSSRWVIISCSDDRTVKIWNVQAEVHMNLSDTLTPNLETGFARNNPENLLEVPLASNTGHLSRIWKIAGISVSDHIFSIISFGEDATAQLWELKSNTALKIFTLYKSRSIGLHTGKNIWTGMITKGQAINQNEVVTGGADGRVTVSSLDGLYRHTVLSPNLLSSNDLTSDEVPRNYCWLDCSRLLVVSATGFLSLGIMRIEEQASTIQWLPITRIAELSKHALLQLIGSDHVLLTGIAGHIYFFSAKEMRVQLLLQVQRKILFLDGLYSKDESRRCRIGLTFTCFGASKLYTSVVASNNDSQSTVESSINETDLPHGFVITSSRFIESNLLLLGSRNGDIAICQMNQDFVVQRFDVISGVHGKETVTSIQNLGGKEWIMTTGRDGHFRVCHLEYPCNESTKYTLVHSGRLPFGPDIEGAKLVDGELHIWGFKGQEFILWNHTLQQELATRDTGGRHRNWSFCHDSTPALAWVRASTPCIAYLTSSSKVLQQGSHGREIKALAIRPNQDNLGKIIATGSEDTCIRLSRHENRERHCTLDVNPIHLTGLQKLAWSEDGTLLFSAGGMEEFMVWKIQAIPVLKVGVTLLAKCPSVTETQILRIMDFDIIEEDAAFTIFMVYSDSSIRSWHFNPTQGLFKLCRQAVYSTCCITQCKIVGKYLLTAATDGHLVLWRLDNLSRLSRQRIHQSSIKCLEIMEHGKSWTMVATGGDDGALAICLLDVTDTPTWAKLIIPKAHASAVNALAFTGRKESQLEIVTVSNDQRVKTWRVAVQEDEKGPKILVDRLSNHASSVADASCVQSFVQNDTCNIVVAGVGLEFWKGR